jgi:ADP-heptose:LPS heptosyltransferase
LRPGDPVNRRHILVITEQGLGDCIMFARYLPLLAGQGARITVACSPPLRPIFERIAGIEALLVPPPTSRWRRSISRKRNSTPGFRS